MKLLQLNLENFKGIKTYALKPNGSNISVYGDNGAGKTTIYDAFCWLMYNKPSTAEKNFSPQTAGTHNLDHSAEMVIDIDGTKITLKKVYHEIYKTQRGSADSVFSGYTTDHYVDGVPVKEKEYQKTLLDLYQSEDTAKQLTRYNYFLEDMNIKDRRKLLLEVCGDISIEDVLNADPELSELEIILNGREIEDFMKISYAKKKDIDKELKGLPQRIDEANKAKPEVTVPKEDIEKNIANLESEKADLENRLKNLDATGEIELIKQIAEIDLKKTEAEKAYIIKHENDSKAEREKVAALEEEKSGIERKIRLIKEDIREMSEAISMHQSKREKLIKEYQEVFKENWKGETICPTCGRELPEEKIEEAKKAFNTKKSAELERIKAAGEKVSETVINEEIERKKAREDELADLTEKHSSMVAEIEDAKANEYRSTAPNYNITAEAAGYDAEIKTLKQRLSELQAGANGDKELINGQIEEVEIKIKDAKKELLNFEIIERQNDRIKELESREKELARDYDFIDHGIYLCEKFNRKKAQMLTDKINAKFKTIKFRLFIEQINGGIADDCEAILNCNGVEVPFKSANNAARINAGLEVMDTLGAYYSLYLPVWVDNAESNNHIIDTKAQQIRLYVADNTELTIKEA